MSDQKHRQIQKVLIANRGEIALRIQRACAELGIRTVSIASEADRGAKHARAAEELEVIGPPAAKESYLSVERIVAAAEKRGADAIHPGYGFLSENADFARQVIEHGLVFIGPSPESIDALGSKTKARAQAIACGVPISPGSPAGLTDQQLEQFAREIGFPVIIKAVAGGGGRGMRVINAPQEMAEQLPRARAEAMKFFGSAEVYIEKYIPNPRHVEVQILGDTHGTVIHLGTRDCSTQRRHQKLVEEAPAPFLSDRVREGLHTAAVAVAKSVGYYSAGTAEFLVSGESFYFLEMNTRIQVEHPVTEEITGVDLVKEQIRVARGEPLSLRQSDVRFSGHSIEFRLYAEDPSRNFAPAVGTIAKLAPVTRPWIREERGYDQGDEVTVHYDAMISKLIVNGTSREQAIGRAREALQQYQLEGFPTTLPFHRWLLWSSPFPTRTLDIKYLERELQVSDLALTEALAARDPAHVAPSGAAEHVEELLLRRNDGSEVRVQIIHAAPGFFVARQLLADGRPTPRDSWRASNVRAGALEALLSER